MPDAPNKLSLANSPLYVLLEKDVSQMTREEATAFSNHVRTMRTSPPTFTKQLRDDAEVEAEVEANGGEPKKAKTPKSTTKKPIDASAFLASLKARATAAQPQAPST
jgi:hypothetical protein